MIEFLVDNIFVVFAGKVFQQIIGISMGTNWAPLLADIFLYSYEAAFIQSLLSAGKKRLASKFNLTQRNMQNLCPLITQTLRIISVRCIPLSLRSKTLRIATLLLPTWICYCQSVGTVNFKLPFTTNVTISISILQTFRFWVATSSPAYGVFISQLIRYARTCSSYECFILRAMWISNKLFGHGYVKERLKSSLRKFCDRYGDLTKQYEVPLSRMLHNILDDDHIQWNPSLIGHYTNFWPLLIWTSLPNLTFYHIMRGFHRTLATGAACQQRTLTPPDTWSCPTLGLACVLMSRPISPELVLFQDFWVSNIPRYFSFTLKYIKLDFIIFFILFIMFISIGDEYENWIFTGIFSAKTICFLVDFCT